MSNNEYEYKKFFEKEKNTIIESKNKELCFMKLYWKFLNFSPKPPKLFCKELKTKKNDKTI